MTEIKRRSIRSFVLRQGRLTNAQQNALDNYWQHYGIDYSNQPHGIQPLDFKTVFGRSAPITLEIGFGNGDSLLRQALDFPDRDFIGIEVHRPGVGHLLNGIHQQNITNLRVINHDAVEVISHQVPLSSLDRVQLFFPDPWHKKRHHKRRILQNSFVELIRTRLADGGHFHMATDWQDYAQHMLELMEKQPGYVNIAGEEKYASADALRPQTKFEKRGLKLGHGVWDLVYKKTAEF